MIQGVPDEPFKVERAEYAKFLRKWRQGMFNGQARRGRTFGQIFLCYFNVPMNAEGESYIWFEEDQKAVRSFIHERLLMQGRSNGD